MVPAKSRHFFARWTCVEQLDKNQRLCPVHCKRLMHGLDMLPVCTTHYEPQINGGHYRIHQPSHRHHPALEAAETDPAPIKEVVQRQAGHIWCCNQGMEWPPVTSTNK
jgi:hypothetical protein